MKKKILLCLALMLALFTVASSAFALPTPCGAHYPCSGRLSLSTSKEKNNTYAFKASARAHDRVHLQLIDAYAENCGTTISIQMFVVNQWGNWIAYGEPEIIELCCQPKTYDLYFPIRARKAFCIVISGHGITGRCVIPYLVSTD